MRRVLPALVLVVAASCGACRGCQSDAERAKAEREAMEQRARESLALLPYRLVKVTLRSRGEPTAPKELDRLWTALDATAALPQKATTPEEVAQAAKTWGAFAVALYQARAELEKHDEDEYPLLWTKLVPAPPPARYDAGLEHLGLAAVWFLLETSDRGGRTPAPEVVFYELSKATPAPTWPRDLRVAARLLRGGAFTSAKYHYAAEEELTAGIAELEAMTAADLASLQRQDLTAEQQLHAARGVAYALRAWNRLGLERDDAAADDLERALKELEAAGLKGELFDWGWAVVHAQRGKMAEAADDLERLAASPYLEEKQREELREAAKSMRAGGKGIPVFLRARSFTILAQALLARAGGLEKVLVELFGEEEGKKLYAPVAWLDSAKKNLRELTPGAAVDRGKELLDRGLGRLKEGASAKPPGPAQRAAEGGGDESDASVP